MFNLPYNSSESSLFPPKGNIGFFDLVKTFPTNVAFLVPTCTSVIVVVLIAVYLTRKYCCSCRRGSKPCEQQVSLATLAKQKEGAEESTYQSLNEPSRLSLQKSKSQDNPGMSSGEDCHVYSDCLDVRPIPISLRLSAENSHERCDHPRKSAVHTGQSKTARKVNSQGPSRMTEGPSTCPKPKFTGLRPSVCSTKESSPPLSFSKGPEQRESVKEKYGLRRTDLGCIHEYFDMSVNSKEGLADTETLPKMTSATVVRSDMASLDDDGVYENIAKANDEMIGNPNSEDPHIYNNTDVHEECGTYIEFQEYENVCG